MFHSFVSTIFFKKKFLSGYCLLAKQINFDNVQKRYAFCLTTTQGGREIGSLASSNGDLCRVTLSHANRIFHVECFVDPVQANSFTFRIIKHLLFTTRCQADDVFDHQGVDSIRRIFLLN